jgi:aldehyde dehydrogenase (NAD+)
MSAAAEAPHPATELAAIPGAVARLRKTFGSGRTLPLAWRRQQLARLRAMLGERGEELLEALRADLGKPALEAWAADVASVRMEAALALRNLRRWTRPERVGWMPVPGRARVVREPLGVVLVISPWNYPVQLLLSPLVGALAAGNCAVLKPSEVTAHTSRLLAQLVPSYLDPDAVAVVEGAVAETTALLAERFDHVFYTGNGRVGRVVMEAAAKHLTPVTLELGGKSPCIVHADANLRVAARRIAWGKFLNAGQTCIAPDYVLVRRDREPELVHELGAAIREFYGEDPRSSPDYARIASDRHHRRLVGLLASGEVAIGGHFDAGQRYIAPTVLRRVAPDSPIMQEEIFGPILPVLAVASLDEAISLVRRGEKPLALYLFTEDRSVEERVLAETSSGGACVNGTILHIANPALPFGGVGESGMGAYHGRHTFEAMSHRRSVLTRGTRFDPRFLYPPYGAFKTRLLKRFS